MKISHIILIAVISALTAFTTVSFLRPSTAKTTAVRESAYDRVLRTGILRCGYADWPPYVFTKDAATGKVSGIMADVTEAVAAKLNLKVEWAENTGWGSFIESLQSRRIDAFCAGVWRNAERGRYLAYGLPIFYSPVYAYVAADDHRFDSDLFAANKPEVRISTMDGEMSDMIAKKHFPGATPVSVPQMGQITDILVNITTHKADIVFNEPSFVNDFMKQHPGTMRRAQDKPFQFFPTSLGLEIHETQLQSMLDSALTELHNQGVIEEIIARYSTDPAVFLRIAAPYRQ